MTQRTYLTSPFRRTGRRLFPMPRTIAAGLMTGLTTVSTFAQIASGTTSQDMTPMVPPPAQSKAPASSFFTNMAEKGIYFRALYNQEIAANPSGGTRQGATSSQYAVIGTDVDLDKAFGWKGGKFHASIIGIDSEGLTAKYIGGGVAVQENYAAFDLVRFTELTLEQNLSIAAPNDLNLLVGRFGATTHFARSDYSRLFMNNAFCGALYGFSQTTGTANSPLASWAVRAKYNFDPVTYVQAGVFAADPAILDPNVKLFELSGTRINGKNTMAEIGYETNFSNDSMPRHFRLGGWYLDGPRNDVYYNSRGQSVTLAGGTRRIQDHGSGAYVMGDQVVYRPDTKSPRNLAVFGSFLKSFTDSEPIDYTFKAGVVKTGTFQGRNRDTLAVAVSDIKFTNGLVNYLSEQRLRGGGTGRVNSHEYIFEVAYGYEVAPGITISPNLQYIVNPDTRTTPRHPRDIPDTLVVGVKLVANIGAFFGLPRIAQ